MQCRPSSLEDKIPMSIMDFSNEGFYITLPSNASLDVFKKNKNSHYQIPRFDSTYRYRRVLGGGLNGDFIPSHVVCF